MDEELRWVKISAKKHHLFSVGGEIFPIGVLYRTTTWRYSLAGAAATCPCVTLKEAKRFVEAQYLLTKSVS